MGLVRTEDTLWATSYYLEEPRSLQGLSCPLRLSGHTTLVNLVALPFWLFSLCSCLSVSPLTYPSSSAYKFLMNSPLLFTGHHRRLAQMYPTGWGSSQVQVLWEGIQGRREGMIISTQVLHLST